MSGSVSIQDVIQATGKLVYRTKGISMLPWIHEGTDISVIEKLHGQIRKYDTVLFLRPHIQGYGRYVLHRVIKCNHDGTYYIMGDNTVSGELVRQENIIGKLTMIQQPNRTIHVTDHDYRIKVWLWWHFCMPCKRICRLIRGMASRLIRRLFHIEDDIAVIDYFRRKQKRL